jgi:hypothetical protein
MEPSPQFTRLLQALKGTGRFSNPKARIVISAATTRDLLVSTGFGRIGAVTGNQNLGSGSIFTLTDPAGNRYAMTDILGFAEGALIL